MHRIPIQPRLDYSIPANSTLPRTRLFCLVALLLIVLACVSLNAAAPVTLTRLNLTWPEAVGIGYQPTSSSLILSVNYDHGGLPNSLARYTTAGVSNRFSPAYGLTDEVKVAVVRTAAGGFQFGDVFSGTGSPGEVARMSADGLGWQKQWCRLKDSNGWDGGLMRGGLCLDQTGLFGNDLIVVSRNLQAGFSTVWRVTSAGVPTRLATISDLLEGVMVVPNDTPTWGAWAGKILCGTGGDGNAVLYTISAAGAVASTVVKDEFNSPVNAEDLDLIPSGENLYVADESNEAILTAANTQFTAFVGQILLTTESTKLYRVYQTTDPLAPFAAATLTDYANAHFEHVTFAPITVSPPLPTITVTALDNLATEGNPSDTGTFLLRRTGDFGVPLTVTVSYSGTAVSPADYTRSPAGFTINFNAGESEVEVTITALADAVSDANETVILTITAGTGYTVGSPSSATVYIAEPTGNSVAIMVADPRAAEASGFCSLDSGRLTVVRAGSLSSSLTVNFTRSGTASSTLGVDYTLSDGNNNLTSSVTTPAGSSEANIYIMPVLDALNEGSETAVVTLAAGGYSIAQPSSGTVTIHDPTTVTVSAPIATASEAGIGVGQFQLHRSGSTDSTLTVAIDFPIGTGRALYASDYQVEPEPGGFVSFAAGQSDVFLTVIPVQDSRNEGTETVVLDLLPDPSGFDCYLVGSPGSATVSILDNDAIPQPLSYTITAMGQVQGAYDSGAYGINDLTAAQIAGDFRPSGSSYNHHAFSWQNGGLTDLGAVSASDYSYGFGINGSGVVVGYGNYYNSGYTYPIKWSVPR